MTDAAKSILTVSSSLALNEIAIGLETNNNKIPDHMKIHEYLILKYHLYVHCASNLVG